MTIFLDVIDLNTLTGIITYELQDYNPDGTRSIMPDCPLDYYPENYPAEFHVAVTKEYKFTIRAKACQMIQKEHIKIKHLA